MRVRPSASTLWLLLALAFVALWIARSMAVALQPSVVQDDARQHVFWMQRLIDPSLFQGDLFADYFQSQAPPGYIAIYWILMLALDPIAVSKLLPPILGLLAALFTFLLVRRLDPSPIAAFLATVLNSWYVWQYDDLPTGSPRAFLLPLCAALLWALVSGRVWLSVVVVGLAALLYPSAAALCVAIQGVSLICFARRRPNLVRERRRWLAFGLSAGLAVLLLGPTAFGTSAFGPAVDVRTARDMAEFGPNGRNAFFTPDWYAYWVASYRSGFDLRVLDLLFPGVPVFFELLALSLLFPIMAMVGGSCVRARLAPSAIVIAQILAASSMLFLAAHLLLFRLYLPSRFVAWTVPLALAIAVGVGLAAAYDWVAGVHSRLAGLLAVLSAIGLAFYPALYDGNFVRDPTPSITAYLSTLPPDTLVAGVPTEADSVPAFAGRPVLTNREYALAYHQGYYDAVRQRTLDLIDAYYAESPRQVAEFAARYGVDIFLVNRLAFGPDTAADAWAGSFEPYTSLVLGHLRRNGRYALLDAARRCGVLTEGEVTVVPARCFSPNR